jgi:uncharacterized protein YjbI with pentapeptide repeats
VKAASAGPEEFGRWRAARSGEPLDLSGAELPGLRLPGASLSGALFTGASLPGADLSGADLSGASLVGANLAGANLAGADLRGADLRRATLGEANLSGADLRTADLGEATLVRARAGAAHLEEANLAHAHARGADFSHARLDGAILREASLAEADLSRAALDRANLLGCDLREANLSGASLRGAKTRPREGAPGEAPLRLEGAKLRGADLEGTDFAGFDFSGADLRGARLARCRLAGAGFRGADLRGALLDEADLDGADILDARVDAFTSLKGAAVRGVKVERATLESLEGYGGLTKGDRMAMDIEDGVAALRSHYSGFWQNIHLAALVLFVFPYAWFAFSRWSIAQFGQDPLGSLVGEIPMRQAPAPVPEIPLWEALARFVWNGGVAWKEGFRLNPYSFGLFCFSFLYNLLRFVMLWKTKNLELHEQASGLPVRFRLAGRWGALLTAAVWGFYLNVLVVLFHTFEFLKVMVPLR